ncbi:NTP transferase domain-containing protein [Brytella acorum]|uniref:NTP transferase domain-containing protein n=1 Tax=Brytella acorum TaxID=2959299 RepID=A0AA35UQ60_9PROT|nr:NTP transferase domain-containing protein [Brytella acorum]MDF3624752.1 NTP transferase domain-containing protein [Brytella acorum]CAI9120055.1 NTP transferase domain-containing protein [Brytella acorum]
MTRLPAHSAVLLAAGGSARLGQPKQALTVNGESLLRRTARLLLETRPRRLIVVLSDPLLATQLEGMDVDILENPDWKSGLAASVRLAAEALAGRPEPTLFTGVDQCRLQSIHLDALLAAADGVHDIASRYDRESFGIPALVTPRTLALAGTLEGDRGFGQIWKDHQDRIRFVEAPELAFDLDTPTQLRMAVRNRWIDGRKATGKDETTVLTLREIKQSRVRATLIEQAMHLFAERGYDDVTVDEIAAASGISRRTLFRYFPTKGDVVFAWTETMTDVLREMVAQASRSDRPGPAMCHAFATVIDRVGNTPEEGFAFVKLIEQSPALRQHSLRKYAAWEESIIEAWRGHLPQGENRFLASRVLARSSIAAFRSALDEWLRQEGREPLLPLLQRAFALQETILSDTRKRIS